MANYGGIFDQPSALGMPISLAGADVELDVCALYSGTKTASAGAIQQIMQQRGATRVKTDGLWGPCSESAFRKLVGEPTSAEALAKLGVSCGSFKKNSPSANCQDGTDEIVSSGSGFIRPELSFQKISPVASQMKVTTDLSMLPFRPTQRGTPYIPPAAVPGGVLPPNYVQPNYAPPPTTPAEPATPWATYAIIGGLLVVAGVGAYFMLREKPAPKLVRTGRTIPLEAVK